MTDALEFEQLVKEHCSRYDIVIAHTQTDTRIALSKPMESNDFTTEVSRIMLALHVLIRDRDSNLRAINEMEAFALTMKDDVQRASALCMVATWRELEKHV